MIANELSWCTRLLRQLPTYGLNPDEWSVHWPSQSKFALLTHKKDKEFRFAGQVDIHNDNYVLYAYWRHLTLVSV